MRPSTCNLFKHPTLGVYYLQSLSVSKNVGILVSQRAPVPIDAAVFRHSGLQVVLADLAEFSKRFSERPTTAPLGSTERSEATKVWNQCQSDDVSMPDPEILVLTPTIVNKRGSFEPHAAKSISIKVESLMPETFFEAVNEAFARCIDARLINMVKPKTKPKNKGEFRCFNCQEIILEADTQCRHRGWSWN